MAISRRQRRDAILEADDQNQYAVVELLSRSYVKAFPEDRLILICRGRGLASLFRWEEADALFEQALVITANPRQARFIWMEKARYYQRRGMQSEAEACYGRLAELEPDDGYFRVRLAHTTWRRGDLPLAEKRFRDALALEGEDQSREEAFYNLGGVLVALGRLEEAAQSYREALLLMPDYNVARVRVVDVERALELQRELGE